MTTNTIKAITFDLWDTVLIDDSDEPKRAAQGLKSKPIERWNLVRKFLERHESISAEQVDFNIQNICRDRNNDVFVAGIRCKGVAAAGRLVLLAIQRQRQIRRVDWVVPSC